VKGMVRRGWGKEKRGKSVKYNKQKYFLI
jgi:hypothetical protein